MKLLVCQNEPEAVLARAGKNGGKRWADEVMELVYIQIKRISVTRSKLLPTHGDLIELGDEQAAQEIGILLADQPLRKFGQEDSAVFHHRRKIESVLFLGDDVADDLRA